MRLIFGESILSAAYPRLRGRALCPSSPWRAAAAGSRRRQSSRLRSEGGQAADKVASSTFRCVATRCEADRWARVAPIASCGAYLCCFGLSLPERQHAMCAKTACNFTFLYHKQTTFAKRESDLFSEKSADAQESASLPAAIGHRSHIAERAAHSDRGVHGLHEALMASRARRRSSVRPPATAMRAARRGSLVALHLATAST